MLSAVRHRRIAARALAGAILGTTAAAALGAAAHPAAAASALAAIESAVTCAATGTGACVIGTDTSSGSGVSGTSSSGSGVRGTSKAGNGVAGASTSNYGMYGASSAGGAGVAGTTANQKGVYGYTTGGSATSSGVYGSSTNGYGVTGKSSNGSAGVFGTSNIVGVLGQTSNDGNGVQAVSGQGTGLYGTTASGNGNGVFGFESGGGPGVVGESGSGAGVIGYSYGGTEPAIYGENESGGLGGLFYSSYEAVVAQSNNFPLLLLNGSGTTIFFVDSGGNVNYSGGLYQYSITSSGSRAKAFTAKMSAPTVEDTGTAQLTAGVAAVPLDRTFATAIDPTVAYRVFVTPDGDTPHGLYVAAKSAGGFVVREAQGGHSTVTFDYRIVATALGQAGQRMSNATSIPTPRAGAPVVARPKAPRSVPVQPIP